MFILNDIEDTYRFLTRMLNRMSGVFKFTGYALSCSEIDYLQDLAPVLAFGPYEYDTLGEIRAAEPLCKPGRDCAVAQGTYLPACYVINPDLHGIYARLDLHTHGTIPDRGHVH